jgi:hypothetical protein
MTYIRNCVVPGKDTLFRWKPQRREREETERWIRSEKDNNLFAGGTQRPTAIEQRHTIVRSKFSMVAPIKFMISPASQMYRKTSDKDSPDWRL